MRRLTLLGAVLLTASSVFAEGYTISPAKGPTIGGTNVIIQGGLRDGHYAVFFGDVPAPTVERIADDALRVTTPAHLPGRSEVLVFRNTGNVSPEVSLEFEFEGPAPVAAFTQYLVPMLLQPVHGQFGSQFVTEFMAYSKLGHTTSLYGLEKVCAIQPCKPRNLADQPVVLQANNPELSRSNVVMNGSPGRFIYVPNDQVRHLAMNLRVADVSRSAENHGTELPVVRLSEFVQSDLAGGENLMLINVPTAAHFRNTLRVYSTYPGQVLVDIIAAEGLLVEDHLLLRGGDLFTPAFGMFSNFPTDVGPVRVRLTMPQYTHSGPAFNPPFWAFVSTTNNETQLITTITPQP